MSSGPGQAGSAAGSSAPDPDRLPQVGRLEALLGPVEEEPEKLDDSHSEAHRLVREIWYALFGEQGLLKGPGYNLYGDGLRAAWDEEKDQHETYAYLLEILQKHQGRHPSAEEGRKDKKPLVEERRSYISKLLAFLGIAAAAKRYLDESSSLSWQRTRS